MKARIFVMLAAVVLLAAPTVQAVAQDNKECDWTAVAESIRDELIPDLLSGMHTGDEIADGLTTIARFIDVTYATCHEWTFEGTSDYVYGPFEFKPGTYIIDYSGEASRSGLLVITFDGLNGNGYESVSVSPDDGGSFAGRNTIGIRDRDDSQWLITIEGINIDSWRFSIISP